MKVLILCGGRGTRLREYTESIPKPLIEVGGKPILWHIMKIYMSYGFDEFVLCLGYKGEAIKEYFQSNLEKWKITFVDTGEETNTGGRLKRVAMHTQGDESFMATYSDGVADIDIKMLVDFHNNHKKIGTITVVKPPLQFGLLQIDDNGQVTSFREKPLLDQWINGGFFIFRQDFFEYLGNNDILERAPLERLVKKGELMAFRHDNFWRCMDTYKDTIELNELWCSNKAPWKVW